jgi:hypothetical protein
MFKTGSLFADPVLDAPAAQPHPYPGWKPNGRGDSNALLPFIDDDLREEKEPSNPVGTGLTIGDGALLATDAIVNAKEPTEELGKGAARLFTGEAGNSEMAFQGVNALAAPLSIAGGAMDLMEGAALWKRGKKVDGVIAGGAGAASVGSGIAGLATLGGVSAAGPWAPGLASFSTGLKVGHYGDNQVKDRDWLHDGGGHALSASGWAANNGQIANDWVSDHISSHLGRVAGAYVTAQSLVPAAGIAIAGATQGAGHAIGGWAGNRSRTHKYEKYDVNVDGGAKSLANYDDDQEAAVERSKREHPERWGYNPNNPTYGQAFEQMFSQVNAITGGKAK